MHLARVIGDVVMTRKDENLVGLKLLIVQPLTPTREAAGRPLVAVDAVGAGVTEKVLIVLEGRAAGEALGRKAAPVDAAIIGIVDHVDVPDEHQAPSGSATKTRRHET